ncbi:MAG: hypothetical protein ACREMY_14245, partial [bacterium]
MNIQIRRKLATLFAATLLGLVAFSMLPASAAITIAQSPLFVTVTVAPNIILTLDDSGSMASAYVPDDLSGSGYGTVEEVVGTATTSYGCTKYYWYGGCQTYGNITTYGPPYTHVGWKVDTKTCTTKTKNNNTTTTCSYAFKVDLPDTERFKSSTFNPLAYDPSVTYTAPFADDATTPLTTRFTT